MTAEEEIIIFEDLDGVTAYYKGKPFISAGGDTEKEALEQLRIAYDLAIEAN